MLCSIIMVCRFAQSKPMVNSEARYCQLVQQIWFEQLNWCEKPMFVVLWKVIKKLESNNSLISKLQPLCLLWMERHQMAPGGH